MAPKPYPRVGGDSTKAGTSTKQLKSAKPEIIVVTFVSRTGRWASMRMSTIGAATRDSTTPQSRKNAAERAARPSTRAEVQPQCSPSVNATMRARSAPESSSAPGTSTREGVRMGDSGTKRCTSSSERATGIEPSTKSSRHERWSTITPESTIPKPPPTPNTAESRPIPVPTRSGGNSSRMIANESGNSAPPAPESARKAISDGRFHANAAPTQPARKRPRLTSSSRSFPYWSPSLPRTGVVTAAETRNAVSTHVVQAGDAPNSSPKVGRAGKTIVCWKAKAVPARVSTPSVTP